MKLSSLMRKERNFIYEVQDNQIKHIIKIIYERILTNSIELKYEIHKYCDVKDIEFMLQTISIITGADISGFLMSDYLTYSD